MDENNRDENLDENLEKNSENVREAGTIDGFGMVSLFAGIISFLFTFFLTGGPLVGAILGVVAILLCALSIHRIGKTKIAVAGRILGIIGIVAAAVVLILLLVFTISLF